MFAFPVCHFSGITPASAFLRTRYISDPFTGASSGGNVSRWDDSVASYDLYQSTGARQPDINTRTQNSLNVMDFDGAIQFMQGLANSGSVLDLPMTLFIVMKTDDITVNQRMISRFENGNKNGNVELRVIGSSSSIQASFRDSVTYVSANGAGDNNPVIVSATFDPNGKVTLYLNDGSGLISAGTGSGFVNDSNGEITVGSRELSAPFHPFNGWIGEIRIYNRVLSDTQRESVRDELNNYWAIY